MSTLPAFAAALLDADRPVPDGLRSWNGSDPARRFAVYRNNVAVSLVDALADNFPVVRALVGEPFFRALAHRFAVAHPPTHPVLALYGREFAEFVGCYPPAAGLPCLPDVARLEWLYQRAWHGPDAAVLHADQLAPALADPEALVGLRLHLHPTATPFHARHAAVSLWAAHQHDDPAHVAARLAGLETALPESAVVVRPRLAVAIVPMPPLQVSFLEALGRGETLGQAADGALAADPDFDLGMTLGIALREGLFSDFSVH